MGKSDEEQSIADPRAAELREAFRQCDSNNDGYIQFGEFVTLLDNLGAGMSSDEVRIGFNAVDTDDDQLIDFREFLAWWNDR